MKAGRTVWTIVWLSLVALVGLVACALLHAEAIFSPMCVLLGILGSAQATKSGAEAIASGSGFKGVAAALMTSAKPVEPPSPEVKP